jgi:hypothetical protein
VQPAEDPSGLQEEILRTIVANPVQNNLTISRTPAILTMIDDTPDHTLAEILKTNEMFQF